VLSSVWAFDWGRSLDLSGPFCSINKEAHIIIQPEANAWEGWKQTKSQSLSFFSSKKKKEKNCIQFTRWSKKVYSIAKSYMHAISMVCINSFFFRDRAYAHFSLYRIPKRASFGLLRLGEETGYRKKI
jgi:hypothetical protein